jgi:hypothetical protein
MAHIDMHDVFRRSVEFGFPDAWFIAPGSWARLDQVELDARAWFDSPESAEPGWTAIPAKTPGRVLVFRLRFFGPNDPR